MKRASIAVACLALCFAQARALDPENALVLQKADNGALSLLSVGLP